MRGETYVGRAHDASYLLHGIQVRTQPSVHGEDLLVDDSGNRQTVEAVCERLPQLDIVPSFALVVEAVDTIDGSALVIATENEEVLRILDFVREQETDGLEGLFATVHIVAQEEVVGLRWESAVLE
jgi:hypothetical protein